MRQSEFGQINHFLAVDQKIEIDHPRAVFTDYFFPQLFFHLLQLSEEIKRIEVAGELGCGIVKVRLINKTVWLGFVQLGNLGNFRESTD